jgi:hypothetical protein
MFDGKIQSNPATFAGYIWICALALSVLLATLSCYRAIGGVEEYAFGCDSFGYLSMAEAIRAGFHNRELPQFQIHSPQIQLLVDEMRAQHVPLEQWDELVAPHAHHYFPRTGAVGAQYPPGTGLALAMFPQGHALYRLNLIVLAALSAVAVVSLGLATRRGAWVAAGCVVLALEMCIALQQRVGTSSYSINAMMLPILLAVVGAFGARALDAEERRRWATPTAAFVSGIALGFGVMTRLSLILEVPGFALLLWSAPWMRNFLRRVFPFGVGVMIAGVLPVLINNYRVAGAWYLPTYNRDDAAPPNFDHLFHNARYYLAGDGSFGNRMLLALVISFAAVALLRRRGSTLHQLCGIALSAATMWAVPMLYFLSHKTTIWYYSTPGTLSTALTLALGLLAVEALLRTPRPDDPVLVDADKLVGDGLAMPSLRWLRTAPAMLAGVVALWNTPFAGLSALPPAPTAPEHRMLLPAELADKQNWIWADKLSGTLRYYADRTAFKTPFSIPSVRLMAYSYVARRGEQQYMIIDTPTMKALLTEATMSGAVAELRGNVGYAPYYLIRWPAIEHAHAITEPLGESSAHTSLNTAN